MVLERSRSAIFIGYCSLPRIFATVVLGACFAGRPGLAFSFRHGCSELMHFAVSLHGYAGQPLAFNHGSNVSSMISRLVRRSSSEHVSSFASRSTW
jgi:hypothetical protein